MPIQILKAGYVAYGFTVRDNRNESTDYQPFFERLKTLGVEVYRKYSEIGPTTNKLHYHGVMLIPKGFYRKKINMPGLHLFMEEIYNLEGWTKYCMKDQKVDELTRETPESVQTSDETIDDCTECCLRLTRRIV